MTMIFIPVSFPLWHNPFETPNTYTSDKCFWQDIFSDKYFAKYINFNAQAIFSENIGKMFCLVLIST